jgi:hypothetical protein
MKNYIGIKWIQAELCQGYNNKCVNTNDMYPSDAVFEEGYKVVYEDGYESWSPKDVFEKAYQPTDNLKFGLAIEALKRGRKVARSGWNGKNMWLALSKGNKALSADNFWNPHNKDFAIENGGTAEVLDVITMKTADNKILMGWLASQTDMLAEDWVILD